MPPTRFYPVGLSLRGWRWNRTCFFKKIYLRGTLCDSNEMESRWIESTWMVDVVVELILFESKTGKGNVGVGVCCCCHEKCAGK